MNIYFVLAFFLVQFAMANAYILPLKEFRGKYEAELLRKHTTEMCMEQDNLLGLDVMVTVCFDVPTLFPYNKTHFAHFHLDNTQYYDEETNELVGLTHKGNAFVLKNKKDEEKITSFLKQLYETDKADKK
jgi:hypothetical protein